MDVDPKHVSTSALEDRRKSARHQLQTPTQGQLSPMNIRARLLDVSDGGFAIQTTTAVEPGQDVEFQIAIGEQQALTLRGRVVHAMRTSEVDGFCYVIGVQAN
jgi:PilZ domain